MTLHSKTTVILLAAAAIAGGATAAQAQGSSGSGNVLGSAPAAAAATVAAAPLSATRFAVVNLDGVLVRGLNAVAAAQISGNPGRYEVTFDRDIRNCAYTATIGDERAGNEVAGLIDVAQRTGSRNTVFVETSTVADVPEPRDFHLVVSC